MVSPKSLMADDACSFCDSTEDLQYEWMINSTLCEGCRNLFVQWLRMSSTELKIHFSRDYSALKNAYNEILNSPEVKILRESLNKDN